MSLSELSVSDLGQIVTGKTPSTKNPAFFDGEYQFVTPSDLDWKTYYCQSTERTVTEDAKQILNNQFIPANTVMVTCIGNTIGKCGLSSGLCLTNQQINSIIPHDGIDSKFVYYLLVQNTDVIRGFGLGGGAATPILNKNAFARIKLRVPPKQRWANIASILSAYDELIQNNRRRIQLLEQAARILYKEWFVSLRFPGHEHTKIINGIPEGWEKKPLGDVAPLKYGRALKNEDRISGPFPVYGSSGIIGTHTKPLVSGPTIIVGRKGNVGSVYWSPDDCHPIDTVYFIDSERCSFFLYYSLQQMNFISTDVAVPGLNRDFAHSRSILVADQKILRFFEDTVLPLHQQMELLKKQASALAQARNLLLPRLMNGEISV
jgi:type I restriction enzyme S subunit